jgi:hypothetical protein
MKRIAMLGAAALVASIGLGRVAVAADSAGEPKTKTETQTPDDHQKAVDAQKDKAKEAADAKKAKAADAMKKPADDATEDDDGDEE